MQEPYIASPNCLEHLTYIELFEYFVDINAYNENSYMLYEDLKIIVYCNRFKEIHTLDYKEMEKSKIINRPYEQIKDRYICYLQRLRQEDLLLIVNHLKSKGIEGYLVFSTSLDKRLVKISTVDPRSCSLENERNRVREEEDLKLKKKVKIYDEDSEKQRKAKERESKANKQIDKTYPKNEFDRFSVADLDEVLTIMSFWKRVPKTLIVEKLYQVSANLDDLDDYLKSLNEQFCWFEEEDDLLAQAQSKHCTEIRLLVKTKGMERVKRRILFLGHELPFELD